MPLHIITLSRQTGSWGEGLAQAIAGRLDLPLIDREYVHSHWLPAIAAAEDLNILKESTKHHLALSQEGIPYHRAIEKRMKQAAEGGAVFVGLGAQAVFQDHPSALHIRVIAPDEVRIERIQRKYGIDGRQAEKFITVSDRKHRRYLWEIYGLDWAQPSLYHLIVNTQKLSVASAAASILGILPEQASGPDALDLQLARKENTDPSPAFVHRSEEEFARILDMYQVEWQYEPTTFPMEWDAEGNVTMAFTPDFYLPAYHTYIELTTMNQKYVTEKNKKVRQLRALYPEINIIILYKKDIHALLEKFGVV
jgi:cytidylate kinase